ncbi:uncharacterized protein LOC132938877 [Metopolophium dirhodum]|uniref:uncharacterized protein LOC132938877 n=1 Tax=Metopolophium dirhodum TaxID=44670 RepID=UPI0029904A63|nr:uncharacterized protein LOC132938877 [Metopolophium dirhodum]
MMINTSRFSKCLTIFLVYNIMIIFTVSCSGPDTVETEKQIVPDFDLINISDKGDYFQYYFHSFYHVGQLKVRPRTFFKSVYNCNYMILPELDEANDYNAYRKNIRKELSKLYILENKSVGSFVALLAISSAISLPGCLLGCFFCGFAKFVRALRESVYMVEDWISEEAANSVAFKRARYSAV